MSSEKDAEGDPTELRVQCLAHALPSRVWVETVQCWSFESFVPSEAPARIYRYPSEFELWDCYMYSKIIRSVNSCTTRAG